MEDFSRSLHRSQASVTLSKKVSNGNGFTANTVYDDVFGGPPKFGVPTFTSRIEDYSEIFGSFHSSRGSSIPILDLPVVDGGDISFDVRSSKFDYSEIFGGFDFVAFADSYEELFMEPKGDESSSEEVWTPAETGSPSEGSNGDISCSENNEVLSNGTFNHSFNCVKQLDVSFHKANQKNEDGTSGTADTTQLPDVPGFTYVVDESAHLHGSDSEKPPSRASDDLSFNLDVSAGILERKSLRKTMSQPTTYSIEPMTCLNDFKPQQGSGRNRSNPNEVFLTVSEINLRTQPSHVPPPSRPPPKLANKMPPNLKTSENCDLEGAAGNSSLHFFNVEEEVSSAAAASAAAMKEAMEKAQARLKSAKESMERKRDGLQGRMKLGLKDDLKNKEKREGKAAHEAHIFKEEKTQKKYEREHGGIKGVSREEGQKVMRATKVAPDLGEKGKVNLPKESIEQKYMKESRSIPGSSNQKDGTGRWKEEKQFYEFVTTDNLRLASEADWGAQEQGQSNRKMKTAKEVCRQDDHEKQLKEAQKICEWEGNEKEHKEVLEQERSEKNLKEILEKEGCEKNQKQVHVQEELERTIKEACEMEENEKRLKEAHGQEENKKKQYEAREREENERRLIEACEKEDLENRLKEAWEREENERRLKEAKEREENKKKLEEAREREENEKKLEEAFEREENERRVRETLKREENEKRLREAHERDEKERKMQEAHQREEKEMMSLKDACGSEENEKKMEEAHRREENERTVKGACRGEENERKLEETFEREEQERRLKEALEKEENERRLKEALEEEENERKLKEACEREENERKMEEACEWEERERGLKEALEREENEKRLKESHEREDNERRLKEAFEREKSERRLKETCEQEEIEKRPKEARNKVENEKRRREGCVLDEDEKRQKESSEQVENERRQNNSCEWEENEKKLKAGEKAHKHKEMNQKAVSGISNPDGIETNLEATQETCRYEMSRKLEADKEEVIKDSARDACGHEKKGKEWAATPMANGQDEKVRLKGSHITESANAHEINQNKMEDAIEPLQLDDNEKKFGSSEEDVGQDQIEKYNKASQTASAHEANRNMIKDTTWVFPLDDNEKKSRACEADVGQDKKEESNRKYQVDCIQENFERKERLAQTVNEWDENRRSVLEEKENMPRVAQEANTSYAAEKRKCYSEIITIETKEKEDKMQTEIDQEKEQLRKIEEEREREREREKDRMAVERATREARERAFADARERAERAAVERATAEARQRAMAEARERLEKASAEARERSLAEKASMEAKLRLERAAVERATAEARERAAEKAMAERAAMEARERMERSASDKFSTTPTDGGIKQSTSSSELRDPQFQSSSSFSSSRYPNLSNHDASHAAEKFQGAEVESAQRCKARLERHQRTVERAAKALAEKNMRDLLAQREQAERHRLAETLGADVKRWSNGKEGNLRALLSTLQYILGPDSGWQPIPLTEVITAAAVKKAYRKATLCVHPDKLQQRGASIQQKYICEKVFDLLKEAWNKFNSEER
uniref:J domain-containing protein n=1 Tax=Nelumbo nucifera TaxID=4432 RepID=A0A822XR28_NELNU|nr:TPA_asm: hypothetical protein HUJ06_023074 [Nelumbo nucifera]